MDVEMWHAITEHVHVDEFRLIAFDAAAMVGPKLAASSPSSSVMSAMWRRGSRYEKPATSLASDDVRRHRSSDHTSVRMSA
jgi:hypothetical protein